MKRVATENEKRLREEIEAKRLYFVDILSISWFISGYISAW